MKAITKSETIKAITTHYIDGAFVESHGREVMDVVRPTDGKVDDMTRTWDKTTVTNASFASPGFVRNR
jgi:hypothetical protein